MGESKYWQNVMRSVTDGRLISTTPLLQGSLVTNRMAVRIEVRSGSMLNTARILSPRMNSARLKQKACIMMAQLLASERPRTTHQVRYYVKGQYLLASAIHSTLPASDQLEPSLVSRPSLGTGSARCIGQDDNQTLAHSQKTPSILVC
jgi:hypothetical protein